MLASQKIWPILFVLILLSCDSTKKEAISQLDKDFLIIEESQLELVSNYEKCLSVFADESNTSDGNRRIFCTLTTNHANQLEQLSLNNTKNLVKSGYTISVDAKNYYRLFFQYTTEEYVAGVIKYGVLYSNIISQRDSVYSLNLSNIETLKHLDAHNSIIELNEYSE